MIKKQFLFLFTFIFAMSLSSQIYIKGKVTTINKIPLDGAAVYFNNTMVGTTTNSKGEFSLQIKEGQHELIVSFLGFKRLNYLLNTNKNEKNIHIILEEEENVLDEVVIKKTKFNQYWKYNLATFKKEFLGLTKLSKSCIILNPKVLQFHYNRKKNVFTAIAKEPLKIKHKGLGYLITYDLVSFKRSGNYVSYLGYSRYENLEGGNSKQKRWKKNRLLSYNGSQIHFYKAVLNNKLKEQGYLVDLFKRVPNKDRPSEKKIKEARELIKLHRKSVEFTKIMNYPKSAIDSAIVILEKARLPRYKDFLYKQDIDFEEIVAVKNNSIYLNFENNLSVTYTNEKEEEGFLLRIPFSKRRPPAFQNSYVIPKKSATVLNSNGLLENPLDVIYEGYWSYEKFANSLPLDYNPSNN